MRGGRLIRQARRRAGLSQAELAHRLGTKQPVIARWETGARSPDYDSVARVVTACGFELEPLLTEADPQTDAQIRRWLRMTPEERLLANQDMIDTEIWAQSARTIRKLVDS